ncbi:tetratricopeptide repeat protein [Alkalispirochaeta alkalica]|uniref:tetratricopeptide repeat protein n=1 Tax=Alkalispirochaeta alkalica TaxID=46356 RepID=UPI000372ED74|nr:tetratricopeptide repeat protein [Alkalispirochaeta alkalica]
MKRPAKNLDAAQRLYRRRRYAQVITLLESQVFLYRNNYRYYYLLGMSCLYTGDYAGAFSYLQRALDIEEDPQGLLGLGATLLRRRQTDQALRTYLDLIDHDPRNRRGQRALQWLRTMEDPDEVLQWFEDRRIHKILPRRPLTLPAALFPILVATLLIALSAFAFSRGIPRALFAAPEPRPGVELVHIAGHTPDQLLDSSDDPARFDLTPREIEALFRRVGDLFQKGRDNLVRKELNRIAASNAAPGIKARAATIRDYLHTPDFATFQDGFTYTEAVRDPELHHQVYVRWQGRVANLRIGESLITFDLLVGYHTGQVLEGIVPVSLDFAVVLENNAAVEIIALLDTKPDGSFRARVSSIRILSPREMTS